MKTKKSFQAVAALLFAYLMATVAVFALAVPLVPALIVACLIQFIIVPFVQVPAGSLNSLIGVMVTGAGVVTPIDLPFVPSIVLVGTTDTDLPIQGITTSVGGRTTQEITDQNVIQAISKLFMQGLLGADVKVGQCWKVATGEIELTGGQKFRINLENAGATTPNVYAFSDKKTGSPVAVNQDSINARGNAIIEGVTSLLFEDTNFSKADINFNDGHTESDLSLVEIAAMLTMDYTTDADGKLAGVNCINFAGNNIKSVKLYAGTGGSLAYYMVTI